MFSPFRSFKLPSASFFQHRRYSRSLLLKPVAMVLDRLLRRPVFLVAKPFVLSGKVIFMTMAVRRLYRRWTSLRATWGVRQVNIMRPQLVLPWCTCTPERRQLCVRVWCGAEDFSAGLNTAIWSLGWRKMGYSPWQLVPIFALTRMIRSSLRKMKNAMSCQNTTKDQDCSLWQSLAVWLTVCPLLPCYYNGW